MCLFLILLPWPGSPQQCWIGTVVTDAWSLFLILKEMFFLIFIMKYTVFIVGIVFASVFILVCILYQIKAVFSVLSLQSFKNSEGMLNFINFSVLIWSSDFCPLSLGCITLTSFLITNQLCILVRNPICLFIIQFCLLVIFF